MRAINIASRSGGALAPLTKSPVSSFTTLVAVARQRGLCAHPNAELAFYTFASGQDAHVYEDEKSPFISTRVRNLGTKSCGMRKHRPEEDVGLPLQRMSANNIASLVRGSRWTSVRSLTKSG